MSEGWIKLHRKLKNSDLWLSEKFTSAQAWVDLLMLANHNRRIINVRGIRLEIVRGQCGYSVYTLATRWKWSRGKVIRFLKFLEQENMIKIIQQKNCVTTIISIVNYDAYQSGDTANEIANRQQTDTNKNVKKVNNDIDKSISYTTISDFYLKQEKIANKYLEYNPNNARIKTEVAAYKDFIEFLYDWKRKDKKDCIGTPLQAPFVNVLSLHKQLKFVDFVIHYANAKALNIDFYATIRAMENKPDLLKKNYDLNLTLYAWIKPFKND